MNGNSPPLHVGKTVERLLRAFTPKRGAWVCRPLRSRGGTFVSMMQTANLRERDDLACRGWLYAARPRTMLVERKMCSGPVMILKIPRKDAAQVALVEDDDVIQTFAADRSDESLDIRILPG